jgi:hypothetical protein
VGMRIDAAGRVKFDQSYADQGGEEARAAADLAALRREFPRFTIDRYPPRYGGPAYYAATRRAGEQDVHPYHVSTHDLGELRRELATGQSRQAPA